MKRGRGGTGSGRAPGRGATLSACLVAALCAAGGGAANAATTVDVTVKDSAGAGATDFPTTVVIPLPEGQYPNTAGFSLGVPAQFEVIERWANKDNSIRHVAAHFQATVPAGGQAVYTFRTDGANPSPAQPVVVQDAGSSLTVTTGPLRFVVNKTAFDILDTVWYDLDQSGTYETAERIILPSPTHGARVVACDNVGTNANCSATETQDDSGLPPDTVTIEESGPMRAVIRAERFTRYNGANDHKHGYVVRIYAYAGKPWVKVDYQVINAATGPALDSGKWARPWYFESLNLEWNLELSGTATVKTGLAGGVVDSRALGSGGVEFAYTMHDNYALRPAAGGTSFASCTDPTTDGTNSCDTAGFMDLSSATWGVQVAMRNMWELWPSGFQASDPTNYTLQVQLFPDWSGNFHNGAIQPQHWLDDMEAVYKEVLLNFHGPTPSDAALTALARNFDRYPVPTLPAAYYRSTAVTLDLDGLNPRATSFGASVPLETNSTSDMTESSADYRMGWRRWYADDIPRLADSEGGGDGPVGEEEFLATQSPDDYWKAERWVLGDLNTRPIWMGKDYTHAGDYATLQLDQSPYGNGTPSQLHWRADPVDGGTYAIAGSGRFAESRDFLHSWFYHMASYWYTDNLWVKDWMTWMGEFSRRIFVAGAEGGLPGERGWGHAIWRQWQSYRVTGNTALLDEIVDWVVNELRPNLNPLCGRTMDPSYPYSTATLEVAYLLRGLESLDREFRGVDWQRWADLFTYISAHEEWIQWYGRYAYRPSTEPDCYVHPSSSGTAWNAPDPVAWYYWKTGKPRFKTFNDTYVNSGIAGSRPYVSATPEGRLFVVDSGAGGYGDDEWDGRYAGRAYFFVDDATRADTQPPPAVTNLAATLNASNLSLTWAPPAGAAYYLLVWADRPIEECTSGCATDPQATNTTSYRNWWAATPDACDAAGCPGSATISGVTCNPCYAAVFSFDASDNMSAMSNVAPSTTGGQTIPLPPQNPRVN